MSISFSVKLIIVDRYEPDGMSSVFPLENGMLVSRREETEVELGNFRVLRQGFSLTPEEYCGERNVSTAEFLQAISACDYIGCEVARSAIRLYESVGCELECKVSFG